MSCMTIWNDTDIRIMMVVAAQRLYQHTIYTIMKLCWYVEYISSSSCLLNYAITHRAQLPALELNASTDCTGNQEVWINIVSIIMVNLWWTCATLTLLRWASLIFIHLCSALTSTPLPQPSRQCLADRWVVMFWFNACPTSGCFFLHLQCLQGSSDLADQLKTLPIWNKNEIVLKPCKITLCTFKIQRCWERCALGFLNISQRIL